MNTEERIKELEGRIEQLEEQNEKNKTHFILNDAQLKLLTTALEKIEAYLYMINVRGK